MGIQAIDSIPSIVLTRPERQAREFADLLEDLSARIMISPVLEIKSLPVTHGLRPDDILVLTSKHGVWFASKLWGLAGRKAYVVGKMTAQLAQDLGASTIGVAKDASTLADLILAQNPTEALVHVRGRHLAGDLKARLSRNGTTVRDIIAYDQVALPLSDKARDALKENSTVIFPLFSPRTARIIGDELSGIRVQAKLHLVSISSAVDAAWTGPIPASRCHAATPDAMAMIEEVRKVVERLT